MLMEIRPKVNEMCDKKEDCSIICDFIIDYLRFLTKFITFGIMYGRKAPSLAYGELQCSVPEAQKYIDNFLMTYKDFWRWQKKMQLQAREEGHVQTLFGHKRRWHLVTQDTLYKLENQAVNTPIQGTAAQYTIQRLAELHKSLKETGWGWVLFTVHDSIVFEVKKKHLKQALPLIEEVMTHSPFESTVPFRIDVEVGPTYKRVEGVEFKDNDWVPTKPNKCSDWLKETLS
jgi:DNA polymerase-1